MTVKNFKMNIKAISRSIEKNQWRIQPVPRPRLWRSWFFRFSWTAGKCREAPIGKIKQKGPRSENSKSSSTNRRLNGSSWPRYLQLSSYGVIIRDQQGIVSQFVAIVAQWRTTIIPCHIRSIRTLIMNRRKKDMRIPTRIGKSEI